MVSAENNANKDELKQLQESKRNLEQELEKVRLRQLLLASCKSQLISGVLWLSRSHRETLMCHHFITGSD